MNCSHLNQIHAAEPRRTFRMHGSLATSSIHRLNVSLKHGLCKYRDLRAPFPSCSGKQGQTLRSAYDYVWIRDVDTVTLVIASLEVAGLDPCHAVGNLVVRNVWPGTAVLITCQIFERPQTVPFSSYWKISNPTTLTVKAPVWQEYQPSSLPTDPISRHVWNIPSVSTVVQEQDNELHCLWRLQSTFLPEIPWGSLWELELPF